jgi:hypothetical protein
MRSTSVLLSICTLLALAPLARTASAEEIPVGDLTVFFDIRPEQCPNRLITGFDGFLPPTVPTAILGTDEVDVTNIQASSLLLIVPGGGGFGDISIPPIQTDELDVATPVEDPSFCNCTAAGPDVTLDLTALFDQNAILNALEIVNPGNVQPEFELCITGVLENGAPFIGCDCVLVDTIPLGVQPLSWGRAKSGYR